jgi:hypothetical protein
VAGGDRGGHAGAAAADLRGLALITGAWTLDALVQAVAGTSPWFWSLEHLKLAVSGHALCPADEAALADRLSGALGRAT